MEAGSKVYIAGRGLAGGALARRLAHAGYTNVVVSSTRDFDLTSFDQTDQFFEREKPEYVFVAAAKVGGIKANDTFPGDFIRINLLIQTNLIECARRHNVKKLLFLGSSCIYPKFAPQPMQEEHLLTGKLEPTNDAYAIAKISGIIMCKAYNRQHGTNFVCAMPTNLYGEGDNFDLNNSHVLPALLRKFHEAKVQGKPTVEVWGSGAPRREFLFADDLADGLIHMMNHFNPPRDTRDDGQMFLNVGTGVDVTIKELAELIQRIVGYNGTIEWNTSMPDGAGRKLLDVSKIKALGWEATHTLEAGLQRTYEWYLQQPDTAK